MGIDKLEDSVALTTEEEREAREKRLEDARSLLGITDPMTKEVIAKPPPILSKHGDFGDEVFLRRRKVGILTGEPGIGKSTVTAGIALGMAAGLDEVAGFSVVRGKVLVLASEDDEDEYIERLDFYAKKYNIDKSRFKDRILFSDQYQLLWNIKDGTPTSNEKWDALWEMVEQEGCRLVIIDPVMKYVQFNNSNSDDEVGAFLGELLEKAKQHDCGVLLVTHSNKEGIKATRRGEDPSADVIRGSGAWFQFSRSVCTVFKEVEQRKVEAEAQKDGLKPKHAKITIRNVKNNNGPTGWNIYLAGTPSKWDGFHIDEDPFVVERVESPRERVVLENEFGTIHEKDGKYTVSDRDNVVISVHTSEKAAIETLNGDDF